MLTLGGFEQMVLLAALRLENEASAVTIRSELEVHTGRSVSRGALYTVLDRLETKGHLRSRMADPTPERGGRAKRYYRVTASGVKALKTSRTVMLSLWRGLDSLLDKNS